MPSNTSVTRQVYIDGVKATVDEWDQAICLAYGKETEYPYCTPVNQRLLIGESISEDYWGFANSSASGIVGFGSGSPIFDILNYEATESYFNYSISISNFTDWSFAEENKNYKHSDSTIKFG